MTGRHFGAAYRRIERIFAGGSVAGLSEGVLLERFVTRGDEAAFEAIVARHGPMVLGICRRVLRDPNDVEDAFQATFLVLVRKAGSLRHRDLLGNWLFGVASRVAMQAQGVAARRRRVEGSSPTTACRADPAPPAVDDHESGAILHQELCRLPETYRTAVLLCYMEGLTHEEAARQLGWPLGTVKGRLARARELLRKRLTRRGVVLSASAVSAAVTRQAEAAVPATLVQSTIKAALSVAAGRALAAGVVAANVAALMKGASNTMFLNTLKLVVMVLVAGVITTGAGVWAFQDPASQERPDPQPPTRATPRAPASARDSTVVKRAGREAIAVLAPQVAARDRTPATRAVLAKLEENVHMSFSNATPLEDVLSYIQAATKGPNDVGIQFYVDPLGLKEKPTTATVNLNLEGVPLRTTLRLLLKQLELAYCVREGIVIISSVDGILEELKEADAANEVAITPGPGAAAEARAAAPILPPPPLAVRPKKAIAEAARSGETPQALQPAGAGSAVRNHAGDPKWEAIQKALNVPVKLSIAKETPLGDVFKSLKQATEPPRDLAIPVYIDPSIDKVVIPAEFDVEGIPLRTVLTLLLSQVEGSWDVQDGLLIVSTMQGLSDYRRIATHFSSQPGSDNDDNDGMSPTNVSPELKAKLDAPITLSFPKPTPLDEVVKAIRAATKDAGTAGISVFYGPPVYVDSEDTIGQPRLAAPRPDELQAHMRKIGALPVRIDVKAVPLRTCLALLLGQRPPKLVSPRPIEASDYPWPPLDGRLIDGVLIIGAHDWVQSIQHSQGGMRRGPGMGVRGGFR